MFSYLMLMYAELHCRSYFSFLKGVSSPEKLIRTASNYGYDAIAITDDDGVYGIVRAHEEARKTGLKFIVGSHLSVRFDDGRVRVPLVLLVMNATGYRNLCQLLTMGRRASKKGHSVVTPRQVASCSEGLLALYVEQPDPGMMSLWKSVFHDRFYVGVSRHGVAGEGKRNTQIVNCANELGLELVALGNVHGATRSDKSLQDVVMCIREGITLDEAGSRLSSNGERCLRSPEELQKIFFDRPEWLENSLKIARRCSFSLEELKYAFPVHVVPEGYTPMGFLREQVTRGAEERYGPCIPSEVQSQLNHELSLIETLDFPAYFLTVWDIVQFARRRGILCQGRGSAANSVVCYVLGITSIDPVRLNLLFERFISLERGEPPDIDVDFEHERREEVLQYVYERYGRKHAAMVCEVITYRTRSAIRDVGKVLGFSTEEVGRLSKIAGRDSLDSFSGRLSGQVEGGGSETAFHWLIHLARQLKDSPRHLGIHSGGFVITRGLVTDLVPVENASMAGRTVVQWDKSDLETMGVLKIDLLALGMLTCIRKAFEMVYHAHGERLTLQNLPQGDPAVYEEMSQGDTIGVFQVESRAQMTMLPRLKPRSFYDLVVEIALIRPGPIQGDMVHPYLRRRQGLEPIEFPHPAVERILGKTYGVPLFQEQVMRLAIAAGGFTPGEADQLRRAMGAWRKRGQMESLSRKLIGGLMENGMEEAYARRIFEQIQGFGEYGFPESHAASFAVLVYASGYLRCHHRVAFTAALLNSQPMGFYSTSTIVQDARRHGVCVLPVDIQYSDWDCTLERLPSSTGRDTPPPYAVRLGLRVIRGMKRSLAERIVHVRRDKPYSGIVDVMLRGRIPRSCLLRIGGAGGFRAMGLDRREAIWAVQSLPPVASPLLAPALRVDDPWKGLPPLSQTDELMGEYETTGLSVASHPMALVREQLGQRGMLTSSDIKKSAKKHWVVVAGMVITRQKPGTASGVMFITLEDEEGHTNVVVWPRVAERFREIIRDEIMLCVRGKVDRQGGVCHVIAHNIQPLKALDSPQSVRPRSFR